MKSFFLFLFLFFNYILLFSQSCSINQTNDFVKEAGNKIIVQGDNNGKIFQGNISINNVICNGNCYFFQGNTMYILQENIKMQQQNEKANREFINVGTLKRKDIAIKVLEKLPQNKQLCIKDFVQSKIEKESYQVFEPIPNPTNASIIKIDVEENELDKYGLRIVYAPADGITRIKELGKYYYVDANGNCLKKTKYGCENYDNAEDFKDGYAKIQNEKKLFGFLNKKGEVQFKFISIVKKEIPNPNEFKDVGNIHFLKFINGKEAFGYPNGDTISKTYDKIIQLGNSESYFVIDKVKTGLISLSIESKVYKESTKNNVITSILNAKTKYVEIIAPVYDELKFLNKNLIAFKKGSYWGL
jgi:hypothetical protein